jgi:hypothetical protein
MRTHIAIGGSVLALFLVGAAHDARAQSCASCLTLPWTTGTCSSGTCVQLTNNSTTPQGDAIEGQVSAANSIGVLGEATSSSSTAAGVQGVNQATGGYGVLGAAAGSQAYGVGGFNDATVTISVAGNGYGSGVYGSSAGTGSVGIYGTSTGATSYGVYGYNTETASFGVFGAATGTGASWGVAGAATAGTGGGVYGQTNSSSGYGVVGESTTAGGTGVYGSGFAGVYGNSTLGDAVYAQSSTGIALYASGGTGSGISASNSGTGSSAAIYTQNGSPSNEYAAYFNGNLQVTNGTPYCTNCTVFTSSSDERLKKNIQPLRGASELLGQLRPVTFEWKDPESEGRRYGTQRGFIAQDVEKAIPDWVGVDGDGYKTLNLTGIEALTVATLQHLRDENKQLESEVDVLEAARRPMLSGFGEGGLGLFLLAAVGAVLTRRKSAENDGRVR